MKAPAVRVPFWAAMALVAAIPIYYQRITRGYFDDAFMFYRYALNFRHGLGWSWNHDGVHTYGMTSLTWQIVILLFSFLPVKAAISLTLASLLTFVGAEAFLARFISRHSQSPFFQDAGVSLLFVSLPVVLQWTFLLNVVNGMDTMLGFLCSSVLACLAVAAFRSPSINLALLTGTVAYLSIATRPESALCAIAVPALAFACGEKGRRIGLGGLHALVAVTLTALELAGAMLYFGTPVPLAFYLKTRHAYAGFIGYQGSSRFAATAISFAALYLLTLTGFAHRRRLWLLIALLAPAGVTALYFSTVIQIMGYGARYYVPYLPYLIVAAWFVLDDASAMATLQMPNWRRVGVALALLALTSWSNLADFIDRAELRYVVAHPALPVANLLPATPTALPHMKPMESNLLFTKSVAQEMPQNSWLAASEVGYLGAEAPQVNILDLAGLNSRDQIMSGFSPDVLFQHKPDVIWMPHHDYTGMYGAILRDARLAQQYDMVVGAYDYGVAVRRDSTQHDAVLERIARAWPQMYPGTRMADYTVPRLERF